MVRECINECVCVCVCEGGPCYVIVSPPFPLAHGNSLKTCADDLIKFGTTVSTAEPLLGKPLICSPILLVHVDHSYVLSPLLIIIIIISMRA